MIIIGIDPGANGGIAAIIGGKLSVYAAPETEKDYCTILQLIKLNNANDENICCYLEQVGAMPGQGVTSMFTFGKTYGFIRGVLTALNIPFDDVRPQNWQKALGIPPREKRTELVECPKTKKLKKKSIDVESKTEFKNRLKQKAQQLFPDTHFTLKTCDAALIALYGKKANGW
jgi:hypothetical protein